MHEPLQAYDILNLLAADRLTENDMLFRIARVVKVVEKPRRHYASHSRICKTEAKGTHETAAVMVVKSGNNKAGTI